MISYVFDPSKMSRVPPQPAHRHTYTFIDELASDFTEKIEQIIRDFMKAPSPTAPTHLYLYLHLPPRCMGHIAFSLR